MDLGLSDDEFWDLTLREFAALSERHERKNQREDLRCWLSMSVHIDMTKAKPWDFFPSLREFDRTDELNAARLHHWAITHNARQQAERQEPTTE